MVQFPLPLPGRAAVIAPAPGPGAGNWSGAPSAALDEQGTLVVAYRVRTRDRRGTCLRITRRVGGELIGVGEIDKERFGAESLERPALVRLGRGWRLYVSCATPASKHWRIDAVDARELDELPVAPARTVFAGSERVGVKDPVIRVRDGRWHAWICCHPLDEAGGEDRMTTAYATSDDGLAWSWRGDVLAGRPGAWDARGARVTAVLPDGRASYDGRATKEENFSERTGIALPAGDRLRAEPDGPVADVRYLDVVPTPGGGWCLLYERPRPDGGHDLCLEEH